MERQTFNILFWLYKSKKNSLGQSPIYCRLTVNGIKTELSTHRSVFPSDWDFEKGTPKGRTQEKQDLNDYLEAFRQKIRNVETELMKLGKEVTVANVKRALDGNLETRKGIIEVADYHQEIIQGKLNKGYSQSSISSYKASVKYLKAFVKKQYKCNDIPLNELKFNFILEFEKYVKGYTKCNQNGTMKHIQRLKRIINFSIENEWLDRNPFLRYRSKFEPTNRGYLTLDELTRIEQKEFSIPRLERVRDLFVFACYTGKGYKDMMALRPKDVAIGQNNKKWLISARSKTHIQSDVPLLPKALELIEKYRENPEVKNNDRLFPSMTNQKLNAYLKEVADLCEVTKHLTFYLGRHTFALYTV